MGSQEIELNTDKKEDSECPTHIQNMENVVAPILKIYLFKVNFFLPKCPC